MPRIEMEPIDAYRSQMVQRDEMRVPAVIFNSARLGVEQGALEQLRDVTCLKPVRKVLATPDIHQGFGVPIGCVMAMEDAIMPAAVGYDVNCGMRLLSTGLTEEDCDVAMLAGQIAREIPLGEGKNNLVPGPELLVKVLEEGLPAVPELVAGMDHRAWEAFDVREHERDMRHTERLGSLVGVADDVPAEGLEKGGSQLGTLGGGNHFLELQKIDRVYDDRLAERFGLKAGELTVMIHSGSRRLGYEIAETYMRMAAARREQDDSGVKRQLAYFNRGEEGFDAYIGAMNAAGNFAYVNRHIMMLLVRRCFRRVFGELTMPLIYDVSHNMAQLEDQMGGRLWIHRKGATRAYGPKRMRDTEFATTGQPVIIPGSMGSASYMLVGLDSSEQGLCSVNHGAGRTMSRSAALGKVDRRTGRVIRPAAITDEQFQRSMRGIVLITENRSKIKEEAPAAYKDIHEVIRVVAEVGLAKPVVRMKPLAVLKG